MFSGVEQKASSGTLLKRTVASLVGSQVLTRVAAISSGGWVEAGTRRRRVQWNQAVSVP